METMYFGLGVYSSGPVAAFLEDHLGDDKDDKDDKGDMDDI